MIVPCIRICLFNNSVISRRAHNFLSMSMSLFCTPCSLLFSNLYGAISFAFASVMRHTFSIQSNSPLCVSWVALFLFCTVCLCCSVHIPFRVCSMLSKLKETRLLSGISVSTLYSHSLVLGSMQLELSLTVPRALYELEVQKKSDGEWEVKAGQALSVHQCERKLNCVSVYLDLMIGLLGLSRFNREWNCICWWRWSCACLSVQFFRTVINPSFG